MNYEYFNIGSFSPCSTSFFCRTSSLHKLKSVQDKFLTNGYLAEAYAERGRYEKMLKHALIQLQLANEQEDDSMRARAYLTLAKANEKLGEFDRSINYSKICLDFKLKSNPETVGYIHLNLASLYLAKGDFSSTFENLRNAEVVVRKTCEKLLELQVYLGMGVLYMNLNDLTKAATYLDACLSLSSVMVVEDTKIKYQSVILCHLAALYRKRKLLDKAERICQEALNFARSNGNKPIEARGLVLLGDIVRDALRFQDQTLAWISYNNAGTLASDMDDILLQVTIMNSTAKCATEQYLIGINCECQAVSLNESCSDLAESIGCKLITLKCQSRLRKLYESLSDDKKLDGAKKKCLRLVQELQLFCNLCGQRYALKDESLRALPCSHFFHEQCLIARRQSRDSVSNVQPCPKCQSHRFSFLEEQKPPLPNCGNTTETAPEFRRPRNQNYHVFEIFVQINSIGEFQSKTFVVDRRSLFDQIFRPLFDISVIGVVAAAAENFSRHFEFSRTAGAKITHGQS
uniref:RING-type domain-containing protein n=1 Tax=Romanomermis culicivorax TaxID=13658 RepID=A0A915KUE0_ROMCU